MDMELYTKLEAHQSKKATLSKVYAVVDRIALFSRCTQELSFFQKLALTIRQTSQPMIKKLLLALKDSRAIIVDSIDRLSKCQQCNKR